MMKGVILAAGKGRRIMELTNGLPKSFLKINDKRILDHQLDALRSAGIREIVVVIGYKADLIEREYQGNGLTFIRNPFFDRTNVLGSLWFARDHLKGGFYFMHADTYFDPGILLDLTRRQEDFVLCVEPKVPVEEDMKVIVEDGLIRRISKQLPCADSFGEFTGLAKIGPQSAPEVHRAVVYRIETLNDADAFFESAIQDVIDAGSARVHALDIGGRVSVEIDFPEDYERALRLVASSAR